MDATSGARTLLPADQVHTWSLAHAVVEAARKVDDTLLVSQTKVTSELGAKRLLALLAFCYARQIYGSIEIAARLRYDECLRGLCDEFVPDPETIRQFRSHNRPALDFCLQAALHFQAQEKVAQGLLAKVSEERVAEEAHRRITMAMFTDSMDLDGDNEPCHLLSFAC